MICLYLIFTAGECQAVIDTLEDDSEHCKVVINGAGSAGIAIGKLLLEAGFENLVTDYSSRVEW